MRHEVYLRAVFEHDPVDDSARILEYQVVMPQHPDATQKEATTRACMAAALMLSEEFQTDVMKAILHQKEIELLTQQK